MKKVLMFLIGFFFLLAASSYAFTNKLEGQATNEVNGAIIAGASVQLLKDGKTTEYRTATDFVGRFTMINIPAGTYDVVIFHPEFIKKRIRGVEVESNQIITFSRSESAMKPTRPLIIKGKTVTQVEEIYYTKPSRIPIVLRPATQKNEPRGQIKGQVLDKKTKKPILQARVRLLLPDGTSAKMGAITDDKGIFFILGVPPGIYQVEASYGPTYTKQLIKDVKVEEKRTTDMGIIKLSEKITGDTVILNDHYIR